MNQLMRYLQDSFYNDILSVYVVNLVKTHSQKYICSKTNKLKMDFPPIILLYDRVSVSSQNLDCKNFIQAVLHASCTRWELINMKIEHGLYLCSKCVLCFLYSGLDEQFTWSVGHTFVTQTLEKMNGFGQQKASTGGIL